MHAPIARPPVPCLARTALALALSAAFACHAAPAQVAPGLRLMQAIGTSETLCIDAAGTVVHQWPGLGLSAHVAPDGTLLRSRPDGGIPIAGGTGRIQRLSFDGTVLWDFALAGPAAFAHHDIHPMPGGTVLVIAWDLMTAADAVAAGRDPALLGGNDWFPDSILELLPTGPTTATVVWEWHARDHLIQDFDPTRPDYGVVANHPERIDVNYPPVVLPDGDWNHVNGIDYDPIHDWIAISAHAQDEIWVIDHSTTTAEAAGHTGGRHGRGGDLLWRWGNPAAHRAGTAQDQQLFGQHDPRFVPPGHPGAGNMTLFNNQWQTDQSAVFELVLPIGPGGGFVLGPNGRYGPAAPVWSYHAPGFYSGFVSSAQRLPNGNTLVCSGLQGELFEVTAAGQVVWSFLEPNNRFAFQGHYVERTLWSDQAVSASAGGRVDFDHLAGSASGAHFYLLLGSLSGTAPGTPVVGGVTLPLQADFLTFAMARDFNSGPFVDTIGTLDALGRGGSALVVAPGQIPAALAGVRMDFAHLLFDGALLALAASNPVGVRIAP